MSLEAVIQENTSALRELINALKNGATPTAAQVEAAVQPQAEVVKQTKTDKAEVKKQTATAASSQPGATQETTVQKADAPAVDALTYDNVKALILQVAKDKGREKTTALLQRFGVGKGPDLKPTQYAEFADLAQKTLSGEYDPEAADLDAELA